jgi:hypothetical protein
MPTKTNIRLAIVLVMALAAPATAFAQAVFYPPRPTVSRSLPSETTVTNPRGKNIGRDPDASIRFEMRRDWGRGGH